MLHYIAADPNSTVLTISFPFIFKFVSFNICYIKLDARDRALEVLISNRLANYEFCSTWLIKPSIVACLVAFWTLIFATIISTLILACYRNWPHRLL